MNHRPTLTTKTPEVRRNDSPKTQRIAFPRSIGSPLDQALFLQRSIGKQAVQGLFEAGVIQAKLKIGAPNDIYDQEADRVAEQVMRTSEPGIRMKPT